MRTLGACLAKIPKDDCPDWHRYLQPIVFSYNCIKQASTRHSPFYLLHGYQPNTTSFTNYINQRAIDEKIDPEAYHEEQVITAFDTITHKLESVRQEAFDYSISRRLKRFNLMPLRNESSQARTRENLDTTLEIWC